MKMTDEELRNAIEALIDSASVARVMQAITWVCSEKAEHIRHSWQDESLARRWDRTMVAADRAEHKAHKEGV